MESQINLSQNIENEMELEQEIEERNQIIEKLADEDIEEYS